MGIYEYLNNFNYFLNFKLVSSEEILVIFFFYNFIKTLIFGSLLELIWPTQFFNRRHNNLSQLKFRTFTETLSKLRIYNPNYSIFNKFLINYYFFKK